MNEARSPSKRLIVAALLGTAALIAAMSVPSASGAAGPPCKTSGLVIWSNNGAGGGTAGSVFYKVRFTNLSGHACTLKGFPKVSAVNLAGKRIGSLAQHEVGKKPKLRKLANGATATALLRVVDPGNFSPSACHEVTAAGLRVTPPGQSNSKLIPLPFATCSRVGQKALSVGVVQ
ncbi:MAG: DUF4232 domain-containing protein [Solirubrobacterales bacterium]